MKRYRNRVKNSPIPVYGGVVICLCLSICVLENRDFERMDQLGRNFQGFFGWCLVAIGCVVPLPSPQSVRGLVRPSLWLVQALLRSGYAFFTIIKMNVYLIIILQAGSNL